MVTQGPNKLKAVYRERLEPAVLSYLMCVHLQVMEGSYFCPKSLGGLSAQAQVCGAPWHPQ